MVCHALIPGELLRSRRGERLQTGATLRPLAHRIRRYDDVPFTGEARLGERSGAPSEPLRLWCEASSVVSIDAEIGAKEWQHPQITVGDHQPRGRRAPLLQD